MSRDIDSIYTLFDQAKELMTFRKLKNRYGWQKLIVAETPDWFSYDRGLLALKIYVIKNMPNETYCARILLSTIDDGGYGCWSKPTTEDEAKALVDTLKEDVFSYRNESIYVLEDEVTLNQRLRPYGMFITSEG